MKKLAIIIFILLQVLHSSDKTDSLLNQISQARNGDKIALLILLANEYKLVSTDSALHYYHQAIDMARDLPDSKNLDEALFALGDYYCKTGIGDSALAYLTQSLNIRENNRDSILIGKTLLRLGDAHVLLSEPLLAEKDYTRAVATIEPLDDKIETAKALNALADRYSQWEQYFKALTMYQKIRNFYEQADYTEGLADLNYSIATLFKNISDYQKALDHSYLALNYYCQMAQTDQDSTGIMNCYRQLGDIYIKLEELDTAMKYHQDALRLSRKIGNPTDISDSYRALGEIYFLKSDYSSSLTYFKNSIEIHKTLRTTYNMANILKYMGFIYLDQGDTKKGRNYLISSLTIAKRSREREVQKELLPTITEIYLDEGDLVKAKKYLHQYITISDGVANFKLSNRVTSFLVNAEAEKQQKENQRLAQEKRITELELQQETHIKQRLMILVVSALVILLVIIVMYLQKLRDNQQLKRKNAEVAAAQRELKQEIEERKEVERQRVALIRELKDSINQIKTLSGLIPICSHCKKIRNDDGYYEQVEKYIMDHSDAVFSHGICPDCLKKYYPHLKKSKSDKKTK